MKELSQKEIKDLVDMLGPSLVTYVGVGIYPDQANAWADGSTKPTPGQMDRLVFTKEILARVSRTEGADGALIWFTAKNCDDFMGTFVNSPAKVIWQGRFDEVHSSAQRLAEDMST